MGTHKTNATKSGARDGGVTTGQDSKTDPTPTPRDHARDFGWATNINSGEFAAALTAPTRYGQPRPEAFLVARYEHQPLRESHGIELYRRLSSNGKDAEISAHVVDQTKVIPQRTLRPDELKEVMKDVAKRDPQLIHRDVKFSTTLERSERSSGQLMDDRNLEERGVRLMIRKDPIQREAHVYAVIPTDDHLHRYHARSGVPQSEIIGAMRRGVEADPTLKGFTVSYDSVNPWKGIRPGEVHKHTAFT